MSWLKFWFKMIKTINCSKLTILSVLFFNLVIVFSTRSLANPNSRPDGAFIDYFTPGVNVISRDENIKKHPHQSNKILYQRDQVYVSGSDSTHEYWAHILLLKILEIFNREHQKYIRTKIFTPLVQVGKNEEDSRYIFPCELRGSGLIGWNLIRVGENQCSKFKVASSKWSGQSYEEFQLDSNLFRTDADDIYLAHKSIIDKNSKTEIVQRIPKSITVSPTNDLTLIYINDENGSLEVNVLLGSVNITTMTGKPKSVGRKRYTSDGIKGYLDEMPYDIYSSRPVSIFLYPSYWSEKANIQLEDFRQALNNLSLPKIPKQRSHEQRIPKLKQRSHEQTTPTPKPTPTPTPTPKPTPLI